eukprot:TRINITY_DN8417_c0_g1_i2.p1 TRINITY_DN8417_c0_g1~~TRINITY_DN8417_c0_g1_i2.p1  ORF type:complete len:242 (+),score=46.47 TRINITY_DN8417_c0_g1_i2:584-1309(+)
MDVVACMNLGRVYDPIADSYLPGSCEDVLTDTPSATTGEYMINGIKTTCYFVDEEAWTLVMKIPSNQSDGKFYYDSSYWWAGVSINAAATDLMSDVELVHPFYSSMPIKGIRLAMGNLSRYHNHSIQRPSAQNLMIGPEVYVDDKYTRQDFLNFMNPNQRNLWSQQPNCNERAFHIRDVGGVYCRYGMSLNNENNCGSSDSAIGFGCKQATRPSFGAGGMEVHNSFWAGRSHYLQGWIFVR